jgi:GAF domain-containing protein
VGVFELAQAYGIEQSLVESARFVRIDESDCLMGVATRKREPISIPDLSNAPGYSLKSLPLVVGINSILVVPLAGQDEVLGALIVQRKVTGAWTSNTIGLMQTFAHQFVLAIQNARLFREIDQKGQRAGESARYRPAASSEAQVTVRAIGVMEPFAGRTGGNAIGRN